MFKFGDYLSHLMPNQGILALSLQQVNKSYKSKYVYVYGDYLSQSGCTQEKTEVLARLQQVNT